MPESIKKLINFLSKQYEYSEASYSIIPFVIALGSRFHTLMQRLSFLPQMSFIFFVVLKDTQNLYFLLVQTLILFCILIFFFYKLILVYQNYDGIILNENYKNLLTYLIFKFKDLSKMNYIYLISFLLLLITILFNPIIQNLSIKLQILYFFAVLQIALLVNYNIIQVLRLQLSYNFFVLDFFDDNKKCLAVRKQSILIKYKNKVLKFLRFILSYTFLASILVFSLFFHNDFLVFFQLKKLDTLTLLIFFTIFFIFIMLCQFYKSYYILFKEAPEKIHPIVFSHECADSYQYFNFKNVNLGSFLNVLTGVLAIIFHVFFNAAIFIAYLKISFNLQNEVQLSNILNIFYNNSLTMQSEIIENNLNTIKLIITFIYIIFLVLSLIFTILMNFELFLSQLRFLIYKFISAITNPATTLIFNNSKYLLTEENTNTYITEFINENPNRNMLHDLRIPILLSPISIKLTIIDIFNYFWKSSFLQFLLLLFYLIILLGLLLSNTIVALFLIMDKVKYIGLLTSTINELALSFPLLLMPGTNSNNWRRVAFESWKKYSAGKNNNTENNSRIFYKLAKQKETTPIQINLPKFSIWSNYQIEINSNDSTKKDKEKESDPWWKAAFKALGAAGTGAAAMKALLDTDESVDKFHKRHLTEDTPLKSVNETASILKAATTKDTQTTEQKNPK